MTGRALAMPMTGDAPRPAAVRLAELFDTHHHRLYRLARRLSQGADEARDLVQETFLHAARAPQSVPSGTTHEEAWLVRVLINIARDRWRRAAVRNRAQTFHSATVTSGHEDAAIARTVIWRALEALPPRRRAIVVMHEIEGAAVSVIAKLLGLSAVTVRWHLARGRRELAKILGGAGGKP